MSVQEFSSTEARIVSQTNSSTAGSIIGATKRAVVNTMHSISWCINSGRCHKERFASYVFREVGTLTNVSLKCGGLISNPILS